MKEKLAKIIRVSTVAPVFSAIILFALLMQKTFSVAELVTAAICLIALPLLPYPLHAIIPPLKAKGRKCQRNMAIIFSVAGYVVFATLGLALGFSPEIKVLAFTYLFSGILIGVTSLTPLKCSGHACGISGPIVYLCYFVSPYFAFLALTLVTVAWSSIALKRHTALELIGGILVPIVAFAIAVLLFAT